MPKIKYQKSNIKMTNKKSKFLILICHFAFCSLIFTSLCYAKEITILYTGQTHAMLYHCGCPQEPDGGVSRRATLIKQLRQNYPATLLLDSGSFFTGGLLDEYTQDVELDKARTSVQLKAMEVMRYDAVALGEEEFNFGIDFLQEKLRTTKLAFLSNIKIKNAAPYLIKDVGGLKFGIIGITNSSFAQKGKGVAVEEPYLSVRQAVMAFRKKNVDCIILLSNQDEMEATKLIQASPEINILILGMSKNPQEAFSHVGETLVLKPAWQGKKLGEARLVIEEKKIKDYTIQEIRLSDAVGDDPEIAKILPPCFSDRNCKKKGFLGSCTNPGTLTAQCQFIEARKVHLIVIKPQECKVCSTQPVVDKFGSFFENLAVSYIPYPSDAQAEKLVKDLSIKALPAYVVGKEAEKDKAFATVRSQFDPQGDYWLLKPESSGIAYFVGREKRAGQFDLFISLLDKDAAALLDAVKEHKPAVHFLAVLEKDGFDAKGGAAEVDEYLRCVCVQRVYPEAFWKYITCRAGNNSASWQDCLAGLDAGRVRGCVEGGQGKRLLEENIRLNKELQIMFGPTYLVNNQEIFGSRGAPSKEELDRILKE